VSVWEQENITVFQFVFLQGGLLGLIPGALALIVWWCWWNPHETSLYYYPILTAASAVLSLLLFFVLYIKRLFWWERWWASQVYQAAPVSIVAAMTLSGLGGVFFSILWIFLYTAWGKPEELIRKAIFALVYVLSYVCLTALLTLLFIHRYISHLERDAPQPIFVDTKRLLMVVVDTVTQSINLMPKSNNPRGAPASTCTGMTATAGPRLGFKSGPRGASVSPPQAPIYEAIEVLRIPENGGIVAVLRECKPVWHPDAEGKMQEEWREMRWRVQADRWGRVQSVKPGTLEPYGEEKRVFREYGRYS